MKLVRPLIALLVMSGSGCTDPVRDDEIEALGGEDPAVPPGEMHRPGQPCLHCHSKGGPASSHPFAVAGTIYQTIDFDSKPAEGITVQFIDARGGAPRFIPETNEVGNFFIRDDEWPDLAFPLRVGLYDGPDSPPLTTMKSLINREGSCNYCHRPSLDKEDIDADGEENNRRFVGQVFSGAGTGKAQGKPEEDP